jgi:hypothetical protein
MKTILFILTIILFVSCDPIPKKPFIIIYKADSKCDIWQYGYIDANEHYFSFWDSKIYNIGDTIK